MATTKAGGTAKTARTKKAPTRAKSKKKTASPVEHRLEELRATAKENAMAAQEEAWSWIQDLGERAVRERDAKDQLNELFSLGTPPPKGLDGETEGILVSFTVNPIVNRAIAAVTGAWMPWLGKRFKAGQAQGDNLLLSSARLPSKLLWPLYGMQGLGGKRAAFDFETRIEPSKADPGVQVMAIDYSVVDSNPALIIKSIRDELVELVPDTYLGKMLISPETFPGKQLIRGDRWPLAAFFALRQPA